MRTRAQCHECDHTPTNAIYFTLMSIGADAAEAKVVQLLDFWGAEHHQYITANYVGMEFVGAFDELLARGLITVDEVAQQYIDVDGSRDEMLEWLAKHPDYFRANLNAREATIRAAFYGDAGVFLEFVRAVGIAAATIQELREYHGVYGCYSPGTLDAAEQCVDTRTKNANA